MGITVLGLNHRTAPIELRERVTWSASDVPGVLEEVLAAGGEGGVLLSTCNRTEFYLARPTDGLLDALAGRVEARLGRPAAPYTYLRREREVVEHLFRVTAGLDSMVLGESEIQGQVREAWLAARPVAGPVLNRLFQAALRTGGRVRAETGLGAGPASIPTAAVELARKLFGSLAGRRALVLGSGDMAELAMAALASEGLPTVMVAHRQLERARAVADRLGGRAVGYEEAWPLFGEVDLVICSTAAPHPIVTPARIADAVAARAGRPLCILDIAVPRDADPAIGALEQVYLYDLDDLAGVVAEGVRGRARDVPAAERIITQETRYFWEWYAGQPAAGAVRSFRSRMEAVREAELERALRDLAHLPPEDRDRVAELTRSLVNKILHEPTRRLRRNATRELADAVERLFDGELTTDEER